MGLHTNASNGIIYAPVGRIMHILLSSIAKYIKIRASIEVLIFMALVVGTLLALLNANRFVFVLHLARLRPAAKNSRNQLLFS